MNIVDTDTFTLYTHHQGKQPLLTRKIDAAHSGTLWITMITVDEVLSGIFRLINDPRRDYQSKLDDCQLLRKSLRGLGAFPILPTSPQSASIFDGLPAHIKRIGPRDCRIASMARDFGYAVITCITRDFRQIGEHMNGNCEDWTIAEG